MKMMAVSIQTCHQGTYQSRSYLLDITAWLGVRKESSFCSYAHLDFVFTLHHGKRKQPMTSNSLIPKNLASCLPSAYKAPPSIALEP